MPVDERIARIDAKFRHPSFSVEKQFLNLTLTPDMIIFASEVGARLAGGREDV